MSCRQGIRHLRSVWLEVLAVVDNRRQQYTLCVGEIYLLVSLCWPFNERH